MLQRFGILFLAFSLLLSCSKSGGSDGPDRGNPGQADIPAIDNVVAAFMAKYNIPGVAIAITKAGKLVYVKPYGKMSASDNTPITNSSRFRIASISKSITSVGIMKLLEANKLTLDSKVFGTGSILGNDYPSSKLASVSDITIRHLLHHTSGAWPNDGNDPMFKQQSMNHSELIKWTLDNYNNNGSRGVYKYSNFGYCVLGRVIEKLSGKSYAQFIKEAVLTPCGISDMEIGGNTLADRKSGEVLYNGQAGENPYIYNVERMDSHGGWIATATDLARFMVQVDGFTTKPDILQPATITTMTTRSVPSSNYACGWGVNNANHWWHNGSLPGTGTEIIRAANGFTWTILANSRSTNSNFANEMDGLLWPIILDAATPWQDIDQF